MAECRCCHTPIANGLLACKPHWFALPAPLRRAINETWRKRGEHGLKAYVANVREAERLWQLQQETAKP